mgnify:CR=1 FL=1
MPRLISIAVTLVFLLAFLPCAALALEKGSEFPMVAGYTLDGERYPLRQLRGEPILLKVGTTWCPTCGEQAQEVEKIRDFLRDNNIHYVDVFVRQKAKAVKKHFNNHDQTPDVILLDRGAIAKMLNVYLIPRLVLINSDFTVHRDGQPLFAEDLKSELQAMLDKSD